MRILITGSSGMIGSALVDKLIEEGHDVIGLDEAYPIFNNYQPTILHDLRHQIENSKIQESEMKFDLMIHLAANARVYNSVKNPKLSYDNISMTYWALEFARKNHIPKFLFASSRETYGNGNELPVAEDKSSHRKTESPYTASKISGEAYCYAYAECYGMDTKIMRYSNVYGKYDNSDRFVPKAIKKMKANEPFEIWGDGKSMSFTYIDDCIDGTMTLINRWDEAKDREYNIASDTQDSLISVAERIKKELFSSSGILITDNLVGEVMNFQADITKMKNLGWTPKVSIEEGINKSINWYASQS